MNTKATKDTKATKECKPRYRFPSWRFVVITPLEINKKPED
jgi:hypothetical protein